MDVIFVSATYLELARELQSKFKQYKCQDETVAVAKVNLSYFAIAVVLWGMLKDMSEVF